MTVVNLADLSRTQREALVRMAVQAPAALRSVQNGTVHLRDRSIVLRADGLFDGASKIAELRSVVETVPRDAVMEVSVRRGKGSGAGAAIGAAVGLAAGYLINSGIAASDTSCGRCSMNIAAVVFVAMVGGGAAFGYFHTSPQCDTVIYRAASRAERGGR